MEAKEHDLIFDDSDGELEAKQHDLEFDDDEEEEETSLEVNNFESLQASNVETTRKMCEDEGVNFDMILQAQQANTRLQARTHELLDSDSSDEESVADLEVNVHNFRNMLQGLLEFDVSDSDEEKEQDPEFPATMEEAIALEAQDKDDGVDIPEDQSVEMKSTANMFEGMLQFSDDEDEDYEKKFQLQTYGFTSSIEEAVDIDGTDAVAGTGDEGIVGEQELNLSSLTDTDTNRRRLIDDFYAQEGIQHFSESDEESEPEDKGEVFFEKDKVGANKEETKVMTRDEYKKANIAPPPAYKAPYPKNRRARSSSPKFTSPRPTKAVSSKQTKVPLSTQVAQ